MLPLLLVGCAETPKPMGMPLPDISYDHLNPYTVRGGRVDIRQSYKPDETTKAIAKEFPIAPDLLLRRYAYNRFVTESLPVQMVFNIEKASLTKEIYDANTVSNVTGFFTGAAQDVYGLDVSLSLFIIDKQGHLQKPFKVGLKREALIRQNLSLAEKEFRLFEFLEQSMSDIDRAIVDIVTQKLQ